MSLYISIILQIMGTWLLLRWAFGRGYRIGYLSCIHDYREAAKRALDDWEKKNDNQGT
jgi:hypothetical protein